VALLRDLHSHFTLMVGQLHLPPGGRWLSEYRYETATAQQALLSPAAPTRRTGFGERRRSGTASELKAARLGLDGGAARTTVAALASFWRAVTAPYGCGS
jgi:hypothetical protein